MPEAPTAIDWQLPRRTPARSESKPRVNNDGVARVVGRGDATSPGNTNPRSRRDEHRSLAPRRCSARDVACREEAPVPSKGRRRSPLVSRACLFRGARYSFPGRRVTFRRGVFFLPPTPPPGTETSGKRRRCGRRCASAEDTRGRGAPLFLGRAEMTERCPPDASD